MNEFPAMERRVLEFWEQHRCFEKLVEQNRGKPRWSFLDGPITANNPMGVHHAWGRTYKDLFQRYRAMRGHELRYQNGFDCQGLWVEVEVEKELGFTSKRDIERYGIDRFVEKCKDRVRHFADVQTDQSQRMGYWMDWSNSYFTMSDENNYTIWQFLKRCHDRGFVYHGDDVMPWCPRCGTGISQHEISNEERPMVVHVSPTVRFPLRDRPGEYLLVWTTTPWTLTSNVACAVNPEATYLRVRQGEDTYYVIEERMAEVTAPRGEVEVLGKVPGSELVDWAYDGPFDELPAQKGVAHRVIPWKEVSAAEGTGIVHIAPGCGKEDYALGKEHGLPAIGPLDEDGVFVADFGPFTGRDAAGVAESVLASLRDKGVLYHSEDYEHAYPVCWRCRTQLVFRLVDEWFIRMDELRHEIMEVTEQTKWIPEVGRQLEIEWLQNMDDWMISKKRYWGLALPIYRCEACHHFDVIGSREELEERAVAGWEDFEGHSPHRPWIDAVRIACSACGAATKRIADVGNPWLDAGIVPYSTMGYSSNHEHWEKWFPADWISESYPGQFRNWFYAILAMSTVMENRPPFKLLFGYRTMKDEHGEEMHKSKGNAVEFNEAAEREGADAMRWLFASHNPANDLRFGYGRIHEARREFLWLWNVYQFYLTYAKRDGFRPTADRTPIADRPVLDRWILMRLEKLIESAHRYYEEYAVHRFMRDLKDFVDGLSRWYLRRSRRRFSRSPDAADRRAAFETLWECLVTTVKLLAPVIPFGTEEMYGELVRSIDPEAPISVHLCAFPEGGAVPVDTDLLDGMARVLALAELAHNARHAANLKVRQPLAALRMAVAEQESDRLRPLLPILAEELNVKRVDLVAEADALYELTPRLNERIAGPKYKGDLPAVKAALAARPPAEVVARVAAGEDVELEIDGEARSVPAEEIDVVKATPEGWSLAEGAEGVVALDIRLDDELKREGLARDLVRNVQNLRKEMDLDVTDRIRVAYRGSDEVAEIVEQYADQIAQETQAVELRRVPSKDPAFKTFRIGDHIIDVAMRRN